MNKVLYALVYVFLLLAAAGLYFELDLDKTRGVLKDRDRQQREYLQKLAKTIESDEPDKNATFEIKKDVSPVEAKIVDAPEMENVLDEYPAPLEQANLKTFNWDVEPASSQLKAVYKLDAEGKPEMDGGEPIKNGPGTANDLLSKLFEGAKTQQSRLNTTRAALADLRGKLEANVAEINKLKPSLRQSMVNEEELKTKLTKVEEEKTALENQIKKIKGQIDELNGEITSLKDEVATAKDETSAKEEELAKEKERTKKLTKLLQESIQPTPQQGGSGNGTSVASLPAGTKGKIIEVDNDNMFAIVEFTADAMKELKGEKLDKPLPAIEFGIRRPALKDKPGEFVGRLRLRQEVKGKNYVICDLLGAWEQAKAAQDDVIYAD